MPTQLSQVALDEVSLVDAGANQRAKVMLIKRADKHPDGSACKGDACDTMMDGKPCQGMHCATAEKAPAGIQFVIGFKEEGGSEVQSVIFDSKLWDADKAKAWLKDHDMVSEKVDETPNTLRFRQHNPGDFKRFRVIKPGAQVSKALKAKDSWQRMQGAVERAVREKFGDKPKAGDMMASMPMGVWVRDFFEDSVVFDKDGGIFRTDYEVDYNADGEPLVTLGDAVPVEVVYQDIKKAVNAPPSEPILEGVPEELQSHVLKLRMDMLRAKLRKSNSCHVPSGSAGGQFCAGGGKGGSTGGVGGGTTAAVQYEPSGYGSSGRAKVGDVVVMWNKEHPVANSFAQLYTGKLKYDQMGESKYEAKASKFHEATKEVASTPGFAGSGRTTYKFKDRDVQVSRSANGKGFYGSDHIITVLPKTET